MASIIYYIVQLGNSYYHGSDEDSMLTTDEEQAFAFTNSDTAEQLATKVNGTVLTREVSFEELEELSADHWTEYNALPKDERDIIESFCSKLKLGIDE
ncbi:hypothetical protein [Lysinibacillus pakistanensis]|uniref:Uncharacterized protein n=1 Tax=Lysinibacillus pakistanensis TaxID=759811 RepID=A0ABX6D4S4_9BACI|nr:hypothetical protein GDS87_00780 [Lysinibacillus pakistanensis]